MTEKFIAVLTAAFVVLPGLASAQDEEEPLVFSPTEVYVCNYNDGMGPADLDAAVAGWNAWADEKGLAEYFVATMTPVYHGAETFDFAWLGGWPSGKIMGEDTDLWYEEGGEHGAAIARVADCFGHSNFATAMIKEPVDEGPPDNFVLTFSDCTIKDGASFDDVMNGHAEWAAYQAGNGYPNGTWMWFAAFGGGDAEFDFKIVDGFPDHSAVGEMWDLYANGGGYQKNAELLDSLVSCDEARVYNGTVRRRMLGGQ